MLPFLGKTLVISPHFDDACFSIGGFLSKKHFSEVVVLDVFSRSRIAPNLKWLKPLSKFNRTLKNKHLDQVIVNIISRTREKEDKQFCDNFGAWQSALGFKDSSLRGYGKPCLAETATIDKEPIYGDVLKAMQRFFALATYDSLFCPLAVGNHVDHLIVLKAFSQILLESTDFNTEVFFYEDLPYASSYGLDFINSLTLERLGYLTPVFVDITLEMPLKQRLVETYRSQEREVAGNRIVFHAKRLYMSRTKLSNAIGYCERFWRIG